MKIGIYSPYLSVFGGGERFIASIAEDLQSDHRVDLFVSEKKIKFKIKSQFDIDLDKVRFADNNIFRLNALSKLLYMKHYDVLIYMTDGSLFFSLSHKNFLIIQSPAHFPKKSFVNKLKLSNWKIICYSKYIANIIRKRLGQESIILPPSIKTWDHRPVAKENIILNVGRFFTYPHNKKQDILIEVFKQNFKTKLKGYKLILAGGLTEKSGGLYLNNLKKMSSGLPIQFIINPTFELLQNLYIKSKFYWHAAGYGENLDLFPERAEHFGVTTLEAMQAKCVPIVFNAGGQKEILNDSNTGLLWNTKEELLNYTVDLIQNEKKRQIMGEFAKVKSDDYSKDKFHEKLTKILS